MIYQAGQIWVWTRNSGKEGEVQIDFIDDFDRLFCRWYEDGAERKGEVSTRDLDCQVAEDGMLEEDRQRIADGEDPLDFLG